MVNVVENLKAIGMLNIYKNISDEEWEKIERKTDEQIRFKYYKYSKQICKKCIEEIQQEIGLNQIRECIKQFKQYQQEEKYFHEQYQQEEKYLDEEWKSIGTLNYEVSNYGRIRNKITNRLKKLKYQRFGMQITLWNDGQGQTVTISRLVAEFFLRHVNKDEKVIHIDGHIRNNYYKNLKIVCK